MHGLGTIINVTCIIAGGLLGALFGGKLDERMQETLMAIMGLAIIFVGVSGCLQEMLSVADGALTTSGSLMMIVSLAAGAVTGEIIDIQGAIERFGAWLRNKSGNAGDLAFINAFVTASCTVCIGAMAIIGAIEDGVSGDYSILVAKSLLDAVVIMIMTASMGRGCVFAAVPVAILQGSITMIAFLSGSFVTDTMLSYISLVGSILIACVGLNLIRERQIRVANLLPALIVAGVWGAFI